MYKGNVMEQHFCCSSPLLEQSEAGGAVFCQLEGQYTKGSLQLMVWLLNGQDTVRLYRINQGEEKMLMKIVVRS